MTNIKNPSEDSPYFLIKKIKAPKTKKQTINLLENQKK